MEFEKMFEGLSDEQKQKIIAMTQQEISKVKQEAKQEELKNSFGITGSWSVEKNDSLFKCSINEDSPNYINFSLGNIKFKLSKSEYTTLLELLQSFHNDLIASNEKQFDEFVDELQNSFRRDLDPELRKRVFFIH